MENASVGGAGCPQPAARGAVRTPRPACFRGNQQAARIRSAGAWAAIGSVLAAGALLATQPAQGAEGKPNVLFVLVDNLGYGQMLDVVDQSDFLLGKSEKSHREGFPIWCDNHSGDRTCRTAGAACPKLTDEP